MKVCTHPGGNWDRGRNCHPFDCQCDRCRATRCPCEDHPPDCSCNPCCPPPRPQGHPDGCCCCQCCPKPEPPCEKPHRPFPPKGFLLPRIVASCREWRRRACICLEICDLPDCAAPPFTLIHVQQSCQPPTWEVLPASGQRLLCLRICIPVDCQVRDANCCVHAGHGTVELEASMRLGFPACECWRNTLMVLPCVRLIQPSAPSCEPCFQAEVEILAESYMIRWEPCMVGVPKPVCPDLPLYPQPCIPG